MKLKVIGCGVFRHEVEALAAEIPHEIACEWLPQGLHSVPRTLHRDLQDAVDRVSPEDDIDAILIGYGLCSRGTEGVQARHVPLVIPRTHDCIGVFLGGHDRYLREFRRHPGTYWFTRGFMESGGQPGVKGRHPGIFARYEEQFEEYRQRYGEETARYLIEEWDQRWIGNYSRAAFVGWNYPESKDDEHVTRECAANLGWCFENVPADLDMLRRMLSGEWHPDEFVVVLPGQQVVAVHDRRILDAMTAEEHAALQLENTREETTLLSVDSNGVTEEATDDRAAAGIRSGLGLGIDAGGTYTDGALYDFSDQCVLSTIKSLTTQHDPSIAVADIVRKIAPEQRRRIGLVSLATTFATNAVVEDKGRSVGLVLAGFDRWALKQIPHRPRRLVSGSHRIDGTAAEDLDEEGARRAIRNLVETEHVEALALVSLMGCRNPEHELRLREIAHEVTGVPTVCGHELSGELDSLRRATTAAVNARIGPLVVDLVTSVRRVLDDVGVEAELTMVRADGSLVRADEAQRRPVEMIFSGPAASLCGAHALSGLEEGVVVDMGGTTSDVAVLRGGRPVHEGDGAVIGRHRTTVRAPDIHTIGLGGDSHVAISRDDSITIGPRRVLPLCFLASQQPRILEKLQRMTRRDEALAAASCVPAFFASGEGEIDLRTPVERRLYELTRRGPCSNAELAAMLGLSDPRNLPTASLENRGILKRAGVTPTDLLHASGEYVCWDAEASRLGIRMLADMLGVTVESFAEMARAEIRRHLLRTVLTCALGCRAEDWESSRLASRFLSEVLSGQSTGTVLSRLELSVPLIGIGAPAGAFLPAVAEALKTRCSVPVHADVAGAVGAVTGSVLERVEILIRLDGDGAYRMHAPDQTRRFSKLVAARKAAREHATDLVRRQALSAGAEAFRIRLHVEDRHAQSREGGTVYLDTQVVAEATGAPKVRH